MHHSSKEKKRERRACPLRKNLAFEVKENENQPASVEEKGEAPLTPDFLAGQDPASGLGSAAFAGQKSLPAGTKEGGNGSPAQRRELCPFVSREPLSPQTPIGEKGGWSSACKNVSSAEVAKRRGRETFAGGWGQTRRPGSATAALAAVDGGERKKKKETEVRRFSA